MNKITVVIPCYNYGGYISETLDSLLKQTYGNWEAIIVDDGSTDNTKEIVADYVRGDNRFIYIFQDNKGPSTARNVGVNAATGDFIQFLDADDRLQTDKFDVQLKFLLNNVNVDVVYGDCRYFETDKPEVLFQSMWDADAQWKQKVSGRGKEILAHLIRDNIMVISSPLIRKKVFERVGSFDEKLRGLEDWDFWIRCALGDMTFYYLEMPGTMALIRSHPESVSKKMEAMLTLSICLHENINLLLQDEELLALNKEALNKAKMLLGIEQLKRGNKHGFLPFIKYCLIGREVKVFLYGCKLLIFRR
jgi:glycosyltransferase involved in cell wall biosynthesis